MIVRGYELLRCDCSPRTQNNVSKSGFMYPFELHQNERIVSVVICQEESGWIRLQKNLPIDKIASQCESAFGLCPPP